MITPRHLVCTGICVLLSGQLLWSQDDSDKKQEEGKKEAKTEVPAGHSYHGEFLNAGPRQKAYLMAGTGHVRFPVTSSNEMAKKFVEQGLGQLYGFWFLESERSFRQAAALDPDCAMAYWGAAQATRGKEKRAKGFIAEAVKRKDKVTERERLYIEAFDAYLKAGDKKKKERAQKYTKALESIALKFPEDVEAKALLALQLYNNRRAGIETLSYLAIDSLIQQVFAVEPYHSAHHFRIHLWDYKKPEVALSSAALCGQTSPSIAHMWHMPGHIYSRLKRYNDACWQQEASARVDHHRMMRDRVLPDEIHNFAHNNEWFIRNLNYVGRVRDAVNLAKNMIELPRHPRYNTLDKFGSTRYGRTRLFETLTRYELWSELLALSDTPYLPPTEKKGEQVKRLRHVGIASVRSGHDDRSTQVLKELEERKAGLEKERDEAVATADKKASAKAIDEKRVQEAREKAEKKVRGDGGDDAEVAKAGAEAEEAAKEEQLKEKKKAVDKAKKDARKPLDGQITAVQKAIDEIQGHQSVAAGEFKEALERFKKSGGVDETYRALLQHRAGETEKAIKAAQKYVDKHPGEVHPLATYIQLLWEAEKQDEAKAAFEKLRALSTTIDLASPVFSRLTPIAKSLGLPEDWRVVSAPADDVGTRPALDDLGPFRWQPLTAPEWDLETAAGKRLSLSQFKGRPVVLIFYLGYGCLHCAEQLQAFAPMVPEFEKAGLAICAISTDKPEDLKKSVENYDKGNLPIPLAANAGLDVFKAYRAFDDFEQQPLHGTFLIDERGLVRWQDISYEPFMDPKFVLSEAARLLGQSRSDVNLAAGE